jgi:predicted ATP-dependent endonuclease of OLD family
LSQGLGGVPSDDVSFLHQYLTLTKCDLFFADKAVLVEGTTESLLVPKIARQIRCDTGSAQLASQYMAVLEIGGAYAHKFFALLDFLELPALIVTDIDSVGTDKKACTVEEGVHTSNSCIKGWFSESDNHHQRPSLSFLRRQEEGR